MKKSRVVLVTRENHLDSAQRAERAMLDNMSVELYIQPAYYFAKSPIEKDKHITEFVLAARCVMATDPDSGKKMIIATENHFPTVAFSLFREKYFVDRGITRRSVLAEKAVRMNKN